jgi:hypothetical protein
MPIPSHELPEPVAGQASRWHSRRSTSPWYIPAQLRYCSSVLAGPAGRHGIQGVGVGAGRFRIMAGRVWRTPSWRVWLALTGLGLAAAAYVAMTEAGAIVAEATPTGGASLSGLFGFGQLTAIADFTTTTQALAAWAGAAGQLSQVNSPYDLTLWLCWYLGFDLLFIAGYAMGGVILLPRHRPPSRHSANIPERTEPARWLLAALVALHVVQDVIAGVAFVMIRRNWAADDPLAIALHAATAAKWLAALVLVVRVAYLAWDVKASRQAIGSMAAALEVQRYSVVLVALVAVIAAGRGSDILEQMPDVPRAWLAGNGWQPALVVMMAQALLALLLVLLGRMRTKRAVEKYGGTDGRREPSYLPWLAIPVVLVVIAVLLWWRGYVEVGWARLAVAAALPFAIGVISLLIAWLSRSHPHRSGLLPWLRRRIGGGGKKSVASHRETGLDSVRALGRPLPSLKADEAARKVAAARTVGDALATAAVAVPGLGLVRSFTAPALLAGGRYATASWAAVALGFAFATLTWPAANGPARALLRRLAGPYKAGAKRSLVARFIDGARRGPHGKRFAGDDAWPWLVVGTPFLVAVGWLLFWPLSAARWLGVLGTTVIVLGTLTVVLAVPAYAAQTRRPVPLFRLLRLNVTPVLSVILAIGVLGGIIDANSLLHVARGPVNTTTHPPGASGMTFLEELDAWLADKKDAATCAVPADDASLRVQPLILVAAAGGGIRAAWWAEHAMAKFADTTCGRRDVFAVSSVSGGSVGMAILDSEQPVSGSYPDAAASADITRIAGPDALAAALDGLLLHDTIAGFTGLDLPAAQLPAGRPFADRAGLMESTWSNEDLMLKKSFPLQNPALNWRLLFNSTTVGSGCRAIIADRALPAGPDAAYLPPQPSPVTCDLQTSVIGGGSYDFFARLACQRGIAAVTAAMLSARFPFVTPSGVVTGCDSRGAPVGQFVDGGYVDSSGLMTIADLMPSITGDLRAVNARALARAQRSGQPATVVVPLVMYLGNSPRPVAVPARVPPLAQEPSIPLSTSSAASANLLTSDTLLQRIGGMIGNGQWLGCPRDEACTTAVQQAQQIVGDQLFLVAPGVAPQISAPLGWVLSPASQGALNDALSREAGYRCPVGKTANASASAGVCEPGVGHLGDLLALTDGRAG